MDCVEAIMYGLCGSYDGIFKNVTIKICADVTQRRLLNLIQIVAVQGYCMRVNHICIAPLAPMTKNKHLNKKLIELMLCHFPSLNKTLID